MHFPPPLQLNRKNGTVHCSLTSPLERYTHSEPFLKISSLHVVLAHHGVITLNEGRWGETTLIEMTYWCTTARKVNVRKRSEETGGCAPNYCRCSETWHLGFFVRVNTAWRRTTSGGGQVPHPSSKLASVPLERFWGALVLPDWSKFCKQSTIAGEKLCLYFISLLNEFKFSIVIEIKSMFGADSTIHRLFTQLV